MTSEEAVKIAEEITSLFFLGGSGDTLQYEDTGKESASLKIGDLQWAIAAKLIETDKDARWHCVALAPPYPSERSESMYYADGVEDYKQAIRATIPKQENRE